MDREDLIKLIEARFNSEMMEKIKSVVDDIWEEVSQKQCIPVNESITIRLDLTLNSTSPQKIDQSFTVPAQEQSFLQDSNLPQAIKPRTLSFITCVLTPQGVKCK